MREGHYFDYSPLWQTLACQNIQRSDLVTLAEITPSTVARLGKGQSVSMDTLRKLSQLLKVSLDSIVKIQAVAAGDKAAGTFRPNQFEAIHRWYPYLEGYSKQLVENELPNLGRNSTIYDPFGGSGTTPLVAASNGHQGLYSEINPAMQFVARVKTEVSPRIARMPRSVAALRSLIRKLEKSSNQSVPAPSQAEHSLGTFNRYFEQRNIEWIERFRILADSLPDDDARDIALLALASVIVPVSKMTRRGDLRFATPKEAAKVSKPFVETISRKLTDMLHDIESVDFQEFGAARLISSDVRQIELRETADAIITSPPYLNGTNYFRNTKLELKVLGLISEETDLASLYSQGITAGINNVSAKRPTPQQSPGVAEIVTKLGENAYDGRIPKMVAGYFHDMTDAATAMSSALKPGGLLVMDIGDSQFGGVHIPTHTMLNNIFTDAGLSPVSETILRTRRSRNGLLLTQRVLRFRK